MTAAVLSLPEEAVLLLLQEEKRLAVIDASINRVNNFLMVLADLV